MGSGSTTNFPDLFTYPVGCLMGRLFLRPWMTHRLSIIVFVLAIGTWVGLLALYWPYTVDDAYITFRYARNWARGLGLVFNPGVPVDGYTSFAWTLLMGNSARLGLPWDLDVLAKLWGLVFGIGTLLIVLGIPNFATYTSPTRWMAVLLTAAAPSLVISTIDGLETPLYLFLQMGLLWRWLCDLQQNRLSVATGILGGLLALTRPDGLLLVVLLTGLFLWFQRPLKARESLLALVQMVTGFGLVFLPYFVWHLFVYGYPVPNTFYAKQGGSFGQLFSGTIRISALLQEVGGWATIIVAAIAFMKHLSPYNMGLLAVIASRVLFNVWSGGEVMGHHRFLTPALPAYFLLFQIGVDHLDKAIGVVVVDYSRSWRRWMIRLAPLIVVIHMVAAPLLDIRPSVLQYAQGLKRAHIQLGLDLRQRASPGSRLAIGDTGAVPYYSQLYTVDIMGINDSHLAHLPGRFGRKIDVAYVLQEQQPDYVVLLSRYPPDKGFEGLTPVDQALYEAVSAQFAYSLQTSYEFSNTYYLWVFAKHLSW